MKLIQTLEVGKVNLLIATSKPYGRVFYVLFMDWEDMHIHYSDKFSE